MEYKLDKLSLHDTTLAHVAQYVSDPSHGIVLTGDKGVGLRTLARNIALAINASPIEIIESIDGKEISIEQVRAMYELTHSKRTTPMAVIIDDADTMSRPAQNAFLKLLEEPPSRIHFILTTHSVQHLLETILSRTMTIEVRPIDDDATRRLLKSLNADTDMHSQLLFLASGRAAELTRLVSDDAEFARQKQFVLDARSFIQGDAYARISTSQKYSKDRQDAMVFVTMVGKLLRHTSQRTATAGQHMSVVADTIDRLHDNASIKLQLLKLSLLL